MPSRDSWDSDGAKFGALPRNRLRPNFEYFGCWRETRGLRALRPPTGRRFGETRFGKPSNNIPPTICALELLSMLVVLIDKLGIAFAQRTRLLLNDIHTMLIWEEIIFAVCTTEW